jgi:hypothetical protein
MAPMASHAGCAGCSCSGRTLFSAQSRARALPRHAAVTARALRFDPLHHYQQKQQQLRRSSALARRLGLAARAAAADGSAEDAPTTR